MAEVVDTRKKNGLVDREYAAQHGGEWDRVQGRQGRKKGKKTGGVVNRRWQKDLCGLLGWGGLT